MKKRKSNIPPKVQDFLYFVFTVGFAATSWIGINDAIDYIDSVNNQAELIEFHQGFGFGMIGLGAVTLVFHFLAFGLKPGPKNIWYRRLLAALVFGPSIIVPLVAPSVMAWYFLQNDYVKCDDHPAIHEARRDQNIRKTFEIQAWVKDPSSCIPYVSRSELYKRERERVKDDQNN